MHFGYLFTDNSSINMQIVFKRVLEPPKLRFDGYPDGKQKKHKKLHRQNVHEICE